MSRWWGKPVENHAVARSPQAMAIAVGGTALKVDAPPAMRQWDFLDHPIPPYPTGALAEPEAFRHRARGAGTHLSSCVERQNEMGCVG